MDWREREMREKKGFFPAHCTWFDILWEIVRLKVATRVAETFDSDIRDSEPVYWREFNE